MVKAEYSDPQLTTEEQKRLEEKLKEGLRLLRENCVPGEEAVYDTVEYDLKKEGVKPQS